MLATCSVTVASKPTVTIATPVISSVSVSGTIATIKWKEVNGAAGYEVWQSVNGAKLALLGKTDLTSYKDTTKLIVGSKYSYRILAAKTM